MAMCPGCRIERKTLATACAVCGHSGTAEEDASAPSVASSASKQLRDTRLCPYCAETILVSAKKCKHCGEFLDGTAKPTKKSRKLGCLLAPLIILSLAIVAVLINLVQPLSPDKALVQHAAHFERHYKGKHGDEETTAHSVRYNVIKTESLVSPYMGYNTFIRWGDHFSDEVKITLAWQKGKWRFVDADDQWLYVMDGEEKYKNWLGLE
jgi:hypothetical protein